jgi:electron transport complex protein RnfC
MPHTLVSGIKILMRILGLKEAFIGIENNKPEAIAALKAYVGKSGISVVTLPAKYPQGAEKQLIYAVTGREVPSGGLPAAVGCAVFNAATVKAIHDWLCKNNSYNAKMLGY